MTMEVALHHRTRYKYDRAINLETQTIRLRPAPHCQTSIAAYSLKITPQGHFLNWQQDLYGNYLANVVIPDPTQEFSIEVDLILKLKSQNPLNFFLDKSVAHYPFQYPQHLEKEVIPHRMMNQNPWITAWVAPYRDRSCKTIDLLAEINTRIHDEIQYVIRLEPGIQTPEETLSKKMGSCRDMAWLLVQILRELGFATRFVSGYSIQLTLDEVPVTGPKGPTEDVADLHAWVEVYLPGAGWVGLDPTAGLFATEGNIPLCASPDPINAAPVTGALEVCESEMFFDMNVTRLSETPRATRPYDAKEWLEIDNYGQHLQQTMEALDIRLTVGGEPTFVNLNAQHLPEWQTAALGENKWHKGLLLRKKLREHFHAYGLFRTGQGKWYGGEPLPRWAMDYYWRADNEPVWLEQRWLQEIDAAANYDLSDAKTFLHELSFALGLSPETGMCAYDLLPSEDNKSGPQQVLRGYVLPVGITAQYRQWISQQWPIAENLILSEGSGALGYRLPLHLLPKKTKNDDDLQMQGTLFSTQIALPSHQMLQQRVQQRYQQTQDHYHKGSLQAKSIKTILHTALCVEVRENKLFVFLPPIPHTESFLELIAAIEYVAQQLQCAVVIEGYAPSYDPRLPKFSITPDPGVLEVNVPPVKNWTELREQSRFLYETARQLDLSSEKFMLDGRVIGTGGGNHITLGGETPLDSPILRRPDVLRSMITYWQHHPSLSYLFSGLFIGPTSQAPRVDEARHDSLYELEIALSQINVESRAFALAPWQVDRLLRHLLVDITGNTHRAEFCIDKLYSPHGEVGRQGLVELRAFEMPPHYKMFSAQFLLIQTLITYFWKQPYHKNLIRFGTELHDRFLLPHFLWRDFIHVIDELKRSGFEIHASWFLPFFNFRFPVYGHTQVNEIKIELQMALEPWAVLGEENVSGSMSRSVDAATERLQVKINGLIKDRYVLACNGRRVPLHATGQHGEYIAGIRFKAWNPTFSLHPYLPVNTPLIFDLIDTYHGRAVGGCTYYSHHPGGRNYKSFPINREEAQARRDDCFVPFGHSPGQLSIPKTETHPEFPYTLDLRSLQKD